MPAAVIRNANTEDVKAIAPIYAHQVLHGTATFEIEPPDQSEMSRRYETVLAHGLPYLVAEVDAVVAGYAYASPIVRDLHTASPSRTLSTFIRTSSARVSAVSCCQI